MSKSFIRIVVLFLIPCLVSPDIAAAGFYRPLQRPFRGDPSPVFLSSAITAELAMCWKKIFSLGAAGGSVDGLRHQAGALAVPQSVFPRLREVSFHRTRGNHGRRHWNGGSPMIRGDDGFADLETDEPPSSETTHTTPLLGTLRPDQARRMKIPGTATGGLIGRPLFRLYEWLMRKYYFSLWDIQIKWAPAVETLFFQGLLVGVPMILGYWEGGLTGALIYGLIAGYVSSLLYGSKLTHPYVFRGTSRDLVPASPGDLQALTGRGVIENSWFLGLSFLPTVIARSAPWFRETPQLHSWLLAAHSPWMIVVGGLVGLLAAATYHIWTNDNASYYNRVIGTAGDLPKDSPSVDVPEVLNLDNDKAIAHDPLLGRIFAIADLDPLTPSHQAALAEGVARVEAMASPSGYNMRILRRTFARRLSKSENDARLYVFVSHDGIVQGLADVKEFEIGSGPSASLNAFTVRPDARLSGHDRFLLSALLADWKQRGLQSVTLTVKPSEADFYHRLLSDLVGYHAEGFEFTLFPQTYLDLPEAQLSAQIRQVARYQATRTILLEKLARLPAGRFDLIADKRHVDGFQRDAEGAWHRVREGAVQYRDKGAFDEIVDILMYGKSSKLEGKRIRKPSIPHAETTHKPNITQVTPSSDEAVVIMDLQDISKNFLDVVVRVVWSVVSPVPEKTAFLLLLPPRATAPTRFSWIFEFLQNAEKKGREAGRKFRRDGEFLRTITRALSDERADEDEIYETGKIIASEITDRSVWRKLKAQWPQIFWLILVILTAHASLYALPPGSASALSPEPHRIWAMSLPVLSTFRPAFLSRVQAAA